MTVLKNRVKISPANPAKLAAGDEPAFGGRGASWAKFFLTIIFGVFCVLHVQGQDLGVTWHDYSSVDDELIQWSEKEKELVRKQEILTKGVQKLSNGKTWYNSWIREYNIARRNSELIQSAKQLHTARGKIATLTQKRDRIFESLKGIYRQLLLETEPGDTFSLVDKRDAILMGRWIMNSENSVIELPDYQYIFTNSYESRDMRKLVLRDLRGILKARLALLDSLLIEKRLEMALVKRLNEFNRDLSFQFESNRELHLAKLETDRSSKQGFKDTYDDWYGSILEPTESREAVSQNLSLRAYNPYEKEKSPTFKYVTVENQILKMESKRLQYLSILQKIEKELGN